MSTLLLRFAAPLQAWGSSSRFQIRSTNREPTKSGVVGMLAAALGRRRSDALEDLCRLGFGIRIDQPGKLLKDFHTAHSVTQSFISTRYYLSDAVFLVGLEGADEELCVLEDALNQPAFPLFLGRRSCPPTAPLVLGLRQGKKLFDALAEEPWQATYTYQHKLRKEAVVSLEIVHDAAYGESGSYLSEDLPITFNQSYRQYSSRSVKNVLDAAEVENPKYKGENTLADTDHDAFAAIKEVS